MSQLNDALDILKATSRTFFIPISRLPHRLQKAVASSYLCMRAIDQIEDHFNLDNHQKAQLLRMLSLSLQSMSERSSHQEIFSELIPYQQQLEEVTLRIGEWAQLAPPSIAPRIWDATAAMADRMAYWAQRNWAIQTEIDLDRYTFSVAGSVGLVLSDLWAWYDGTQTNRIHAIGFGRGLQSVNILRNHLEDKSRGVDFFPDGWTLAEMHTYAHNNLSFADAYISDLPQGPALNFCKIPLGLAYGTLEVLDAGKEKLTRHDVTAILDKIQK